MCLARGWRGAADVKARRCPVAEARAAKTRGESGLAHLTPTTGLDPTPLPAQRLLSHPVLPERPGRWVAEKSVGLCCDSETSMT